MNWESKPFSVKSSRILSLIALSYCQSWIWLIGIITCVGIALGIFVNLIWIIILLLWIFLIIPMILIFLYFYHGMRPITSSNLVNHILQFDDNHILIKILDKTIKEGQTEDYENRYNELRIITINYNDLGRIDSYGSGIIINVISSEKGFICLPYSIMEGTSKKDFLEFLFIKSHQNQIFINEVT